jgi:Domain of unknown function (DUF1816)
MDLLPAIKMLEESNSSPSQPMWWIKIYTIRPFCIYYFGPFNQIQEAQNSQFGYIDDLEKEDSKVVFKKLLWLNPQNLTVECKNLDHLRWLHELMQDSLMLKLPYVPTVLRPE